MMRITQVTPSLSLPLSLPYPRFVALRRTVSPVFKAKQSLLHLSDPLACSLVSSTRVIQPHSFSTRVEV